MAQARPLLEDAENSAHLATSKLGRSARKQIHVCESTRDVQVKNSREKNPIKPRVASNAFTTGTDAAPSGAMMQTEGTVSHNALPICGGVLAACGTNDMTLGEDRKITHSSTSQTSNSQAMHLLSSCSNAVSGGKSMDLIASTTNDWMPSGSYGTCDGVSNSGTTESQRNSTLLSKGEHTVTCRSVTGQHGTGVTSSVSFHSSKARIVNEDENCSLALSCNSAGEVPHVSHDQLDHSIADDNSVNSFQQWDPENSQNEFGFQIKVKQEHPA